MGYVDEVVLEDIRAIGASRVPFVHPAAPEAAGLAVPNMNLVVGTNGAGKSTVLKAVAAALSPTPLPASVASWPRLDGEGGAAIALRTSVPGSPPTLGPEVRLLISRLAPPPDLRPSPDRFERGPVSVGFLAAYGSNRTWTTSDVVDEPGSHLLDDGIPLMAIEPWLDRTERRSAVAPLLDALLPDDVTCLVAPTDGAHFAQRGLPMPVGMLSDGVQSLLAWLGDLLWRLDRETDGPITEVEGVVLVDEVDQRMHPRWQQSFLTRLAATFPALQLICTGHSPLLPSGLERENLLLVEPDPDRPGTGATRVVRLRTEDVYGRTADQVLESSYFGLASTRSEPFWVELRTVVDRAGSRSGGREAALELMQRLAHPRRPDADR